MSQRASQVIRLGQHPLSMLTRILVLVLVLGFCALGATGCASVEAWERERLALEPMAPDDMPCQAFEHNVEVYREGAVGANGGKSGGGCGCS